MNLTTIYLRFYKQGKQMGSAEKLECGSRPP